MDATNYSLTELRPSIIHFASYDFATQEVSIQERAEDLFSGPMMLQCEIFRQSSVGGYTLKTIDRRLTLSFSDRSGVSAQEAVRLMAITFASSSMNVEREEGS